MSKTVLEVQEVDGRTGYMVYVDGDRWREVCAMDPLEAVQLAIRYASDELADADYQEANRGSS